ncbi:unnamed protein product [Albugo candida]|uniref:Uncharacterized protein n=1 Tax=Albugo candida TaxID=65357 RepID=A0A024FTY8_9STRA|nr:unnamed protein product [Albugo candida]|eukprot:CCI10585.1 unnamed protein product [Albugo candida]
MGTFSSPISFNLQANLLVKIKGEYILLTVRPPIYSAVLFCTLIVALLHEIKTLQHVHVNDTLERTFVEIPREQYYCSIKERLDYKMEMIKFGIGLNEIHHLLSLLVGASLELGTQGDRDIFWPDFRVFVRNADLKKSTVGFLGLVETCQRRHKHHQTILSLIVLENC